MTLNSGSLRTVYPVFLPGGISDHVRRFQERERPIELMPLKPPHVGSSLHQASSARECDKHQRCTHSNRRYLNPRQPGKHTPGYAWDNTSCDPANDPYHTVRQESLFRNLEKMQQDYTFQTSKAKFIIPGELTQDITFIPFHTLIFHWGYSPRIRGWWTSFPQQAGKYMVRFFFFFLWYNGNIWKAFSVSAVRNLLS